jgi:hypothetical protein
MPLYPFATLCNMCPFDTQPPPPPARPLFCCCDLQPPDCDPSKDCGSWVVYPYFISFVVLVTIIMLQLFTAVIIESFEAQEEQDVSTCVSACVCGGGGGAC